MKATSLAIMFIAGITSHTLMPQAHAPIQKISLAINFEFYKAYHPLRATMVVTGTAFAAQYLLARYYYKNTEQSWAVRTLAWLVNILNSKKDPSKSLHELIAERSEYHNHLIKALTSIEKFNNPKEDIGFISESLCSSVQDTGFATMNLQNLATTLVWASNDLKSNRKKIEEKIKTVLQSKDLLRATHERDETCISNLGDLYAKLRAKEISLTETIQDLEKKLTISRDNGAKIQEWYGLLQNVVQERAIKIESLEKKLELLRNNSKKMVEMHGL